MLNVLHLWTLQAVSDFGLYRYHHVMDVLLKWLVAGLADCWCGLMVGGRVIVFVRMFQCTESNALCNWTSAKGSFQYIIRWLSSWIKLYLCEFQFCRINLLSNRLCWDCVPSIRVTLHGATTCDTQTTCLHQNLSENARTSLTNRGQNNLKNEQITFQ